MIIGGFLERLKRQNISFIQFIRLNYILIFMVPNSNSIVSLLLWLSALRHVFCAYSGFALVLPVWAGLLLHTLAKPSLGINPFFCCFVLPTILNPQRVLQQTINIK